MKMNKLFSLVADLVPHPYSDDVMLMWLNQCENSILTDLFLVDPGETIEYEKVTDAALLIPHPFDKLYLPYLQAQIAHANQEYDLYANYLALYNAYRYEYAQYVVSGADPGSGDAVRRGYYLSAYGIAVAHGYSGSEDEWVASLRGPQGPRGEKGEPGAKGEPGDRGADGKSAYEIAREHGFEGTEQEWLAQISGGKPTAVFAEAPEDGVSYAAEAAGLAVAAGTEILLIPQNNNQGAATLAINGGEAYPLCLRPGWIVGENYLRPTLTIPLEKDMLLRGGEYVFRFDGAAWILQSYIATQQEKEGYTDLTEAYLGQTAYRDPWSFLRSQGEGRWQVNDVWELYQITIFYVDGTQWRIEEMWSDEADCTTRVYAGDLLRYGVSTEEGKIWVGNTELPRQEVYLDELPENAPDGTLLINTGEESEDPGYVLPGEMKKYVDDAIQKALGEIGIAEEGSY